MEDDADLALLFLVARVDEYLEGTPHADDITCVAFELTSDS